MTSAKLDDRCVCGAEFHAEGDPAWVTARHTDWLDAHRSCRINAAVAASVSRVEAGQ